MEENEKFRPFAPETVRARIKANFAHDPEEKKKRLQALDMLEAKPLYSAGNALKGLVGLALLVTSVCVAHSFHKEDPTQDQNIVVPIGTGQKIVIDEKPLLLWQNTKHDKIVPVDSAYVHQSGGGSHAPLIAPLLPY